jgi:hypothetical protein
MNSSVSTFLQLSVVLTGFDTLDLRLADSLLARATASGHGQGVIELVKRFAAVASEKPPERLEEAVGELIDSDAALRDAAEQLIYLWYLSAETDGAAWKFGREEDYAGALLWRAIAAHPPGLSGGYMGQWRYFPGNLE